MLSSLPSSHPLCHRLPFITIVVITTPTYLFTPHFLISSLLPVSHIVLTSSPIDVILISPLPPSPPAPHPTSLVGTSLSVCILSSFSSTSTCPPASTHSTTLTFALSQKTMDSCFPASMNHSRKRERGN